MIIPARFNGPDGSGNGGYTCGLVAQVLGGGPAQVTLRVPPPLDTPLAVERSGATTAGTNPTGTTGTAAAVTVYGADGTVVAEAAAVPALDTAVPPVDLAVAAEASRSYAGFGEHPFPACFVCGPQRVRGDGLRIFPGRLPDGRTAAPFVVPADVSPPIVWAALDCPGGWAVISPGRPYVLGRMAAHVRTLPRPGDECVVVGRCDDARGRKADVATSLYGPAGDLIATARATWISIGVTGVREG